MPESIKKIIIFIIIGGLCVSAFFIRLENFKKPGPRTTDEAIYYIMARQMEHNIFDYNATNYALYDIVTEGKKYPSYFSRPLFKHPPLFTLLILLSIKIFGYTALGAGFFPLFFGAMSIALIYLLGKLAGGRAVGLLAAGFMFIDPVTIMSSQKVWMDAPLMFFMLLTAYSYWKAIKDRKDIFYLIGGFSAGASFMIKYPGILTFLGVILFVFLCSPKVLKNKYFLSSLTFPIIMALPWGFMNYYVYGTGFINEQLGVHNFTNIFSPVILFVLTVCFGAGMFAWITFWQPDLISKRFDHLFSTKFVFYLKFIGFIGTSLFILMNIGKSLNFFEVPWVTWRQGAFSGQPRWFYFKRLMEFCLLYGFAYLAFFDPSNKRDKGLFLMKLNVFLIMIFFVAWGNFQCRYILPALPFLMILAAEFIWRSLGNLAKINWVSVRLLFQALILILVVLAVSKTMLINYEVSFTNNMCYF